jgi:protein involved in polysaccharide export with SLBB domain
MKTLKLIPSILCGAATLMLLAGCSSPKSTFDPRAKFGPTTFEEVSLANESGRAWMERGETLFTVGPGDALEVEIIGSPDTRTTVQVGPDGKIYFHILPGMDVWGLTLEQTKDLLQRELGKYITGAQMSVSLRAVGSKSIWLLGRVNRPGIYQMSGPTTLLEAISMAGGPSRITQSGNVEDQADLRHSFVQRQGQYVPVDFRKLLIQGDMTQNIYLQPDDFIYMPSSLFHEVFVLGAVRAPRTVPYSERLTLLSAISTAAGPVPGAYLSQVAIVRGSLTTPKVAIVDYRDILKGRESDIRLEPHDIVFVPFEPFSGLKAYARSIVYTVVNTIAANEGINMVSDTADNVGVSVGTGGGTGQQDAGGSGQSGQ